MKFTYADGATPLRAEETDFLVPSHISTQKELNEWEAVNILQAINWLSNVKLSEDKMLNLEFLKKLHKKMFDKTWEWAGCTRSHQTNVGVEAYRIPNEVHHLMDDVKYWIAHNAFSTREIAIRLHHKLVWIHIFPNGNGRHARLMADIFLKAQKAKPISWPSDLQDDSPFRNKYILSLKEADKGNYEPLKLLLGDN